MASEDFGSLDVENLAKRAADILLQSADSCPLHLNDFGHLLDNIGYRVLVIASVLPLVPLFPPL